MLMERNKWLCFLFCGGVSLMEQTNNLQSDASLTNSWASYESVSHFCILRNGFLIRERNKRLDFCFAWVLN